jgi:hypothetical protein
MPAEAAAELTADAVEAAEVAEVTLMPDSPVGASANAPYPGLNCAKVINRARNL